MKRKKMTWNRKCMACLLPSLLGLLVFFVLPYIRVVYYSLIRNQFRRDFVGLDNYKEILQNEYFLLALKNSLLLIAFCVPLLVLLAVGLSVALLFLFRKLAGIRVAFILPMLLPTASVVLVFQNVFSEVDNVLPLYLLFLWKNIGICVILLTAALAVIPEELYEAARLDGAGEFYMHRTITLPLILPTVFFAALLSVVNSFKIFRESYLLYGGKYPPDYGYTLQFFMNNNFQKFDYQALASSSVLTSLLVVLFVVVGLRLERRYRV